MQILGGGVANATCVRPQHSKPNRVNPTPVESGKTTKTKITVHPHLEASHSKGCGGLATS